MTEWSIHVNQPEGQRVKELVRSHKQLGVFHDMQDCVKLQFLVGILDKQQAG